MDDITRFSYSRHPCEDNSKWLFDIFRAEAAGDYKGDIHDLKIFLDDMLDESRLDPAKVFSKQGIRQYDHHNQGFKCLSPLIHSLTDEALELMRLFRSEAAAGQIAPEVRNRIEAMDRIRVNGKPIQSYWGEYENFQKYAEDDAHEGLARVISVAVFKSIREFGFVEFLHRENQMSDADYQIAVDGISAKLDGVGVNGLERLLKARPDLEEILKSDEGQIEVATSTGYSKGNGQGMEYVYTPFKRNEYYAKEMKRLEDQRNSSNPPVDYHRSYVTVQHEAVGKEYCNAVKRKVKAVNDIMAGWNEDLTLDNPTLLAKLSNPNEGFTPLKANALKLYAINNYIGAKDPRLAEYFKARDAQPEDFVWHRPRRIAENSVSAGDKESIFLPDKPLLLVGTQTALPPPTDSDTSQKKTGGSSSSKDSREGTGGDNNFIAGKIATTAVLGIGLVDGVANLLKKKDEDPNNTDKSKDSSKDNSQTFIRALEVAAAVAGIALVWWKGDVIFKGIGNFFNRGGQSA